MDWLGMITLLIALYFLRRKSVWGWFLNIVGSVFMIIHFLQPLVISVVILNTVFLVLSLESLFKWRNEANGNVERSLSKV